MTIGGVATQICKTWLIGSANESYLKITDSGVFFYGSNGATTTEPLTYISFPLTLGKTWEFYPGLLTMEVSRADFGLTVAEGSYNNCYEVTLRGFEGSDSCVVLAPNVGIIKMEQYSGTTITSTAELASKNF